MIFFQNLTETLPFFSLLFSLILMLGLYHLGEIIFYNKKIKLILSTISELKYQKILVAINFLMIIIFPIVLFFSYSKQILSFFSLIIFILGLIKFLFILKKKFIIKKNSFNHNYEFYVFIFAIIGIFLISFSPVNHVDSLDYHLWGAKYIYQTGRLPTSIESFTNLLVSSGEVLYSLGFFFGAEQFGTMIQFSGLLSLIGVFKKFNNKNYFLLLLILSAPMMIFLVSSPKPQLFHLCSNAFLFVLLFVNFSYIKNYKFSALEIVIITNIFLINSINSKISFILSSFVIYLILAIVAYKKNFFIKMIFINIVFISIFYLGFVYWKYSIWGGNLINYIVNPIPIHLEGGKLFYDYLIRYNNLGKGGAELIHLFLPKNIGQYTEAIGLGVISFVYFFLNKKKIFFYFIPIFLFFIFINYFFGQASSRFYFELYVWMILLLASNKSLKIPVKFKSIFYIQFLASICAIWYGVFTMSYGFVNSNLRDRVMVNTADGYSLFSWSNEVFENKNDRVIAMHRSTSLGKGDVLASAFQNFLHVPKDQVRSYHIKNYLTNFSGSTYLLTRGDKNNVGMFSNCIDYLYLTKKNVGKHAGRNPFYKSGYYDGFIFKLKDLKKTNCLKK